MPAIRRKDVRNRKRGKENSSKAKLEVSIVEWSNKWVKCGNVFTACLKHIKRCPRSNVLCLHPSPHKNYII